ncbi:DeoR/GlpR family DNA-binding transcription regulator [Streptococcus sp. NLN76]|uniref:DeoR/GlpR family DNA-binding transcription regulator n=1 Tax=Streptococcus sp. NLN76 TaxID=2822800 RepID=UPI0018A96681|nr:DeoR/GlpR family DNA-binding transcription regulator [Streptococcus sp. NLN76]MBF8969625.1 DeoR/GlpR transcriptional regulator [Streptococcus sp. NLN76]
MKKQKRLEKITRLVHQKGTIRTSQIVEMLNVTDMTVRRDLGELEELGILTRIHGGARSNTAFQYREYSHSEKHIQHQAAKQAIALRAASLIEDGDRIFLGPGTTTTYLAEAIQNKQLTIITNCLPVFRVLSQKKSEDFKVFLLGRELRQVTESFIGEITNMSLENLHFSKMFFSANGVKANQVMTSTITEAYTQHLALEHSLERYLLLDKSKFGKDDFTSFCELDNLTAVVTNLATHEETYPLVSPHIDIINDLQML